MKTYKILLFSVVIGVANAIVFKVFEAIINGGEKFFWTTLFNTNEHRWIVVPLTIVFSLIVSGVYIIIKQDRLETPELNSLAVVPPEKPPKLIDMGVIAFIGIVSLVAGASLGPEASLVALSTTLGLIVASRLSKDKKLAQLLLVSSVGALLVVFLGSMIPVILPIGLLYKKKALNIKTIIPPIIAAVTAYGTIYLLDQKVVGYMELNVGNKYSFEDILLATLVGVVAAGLGLLIAKLIDWFFKLAKTIDKIMPKYISVAIFGLVLSIILILGGPNIEFSGSTGSKTVLSHTPAYGIGALVIMLLTKLLATAWSKATGYRGGLVFPSIFIGVSIGLIAESIFHLSGPGIVIGAVAGMITAMADPLAALILLASILPLGLLLVVIFGIAGATIGKKIIAKLGYSQT